MPRSPSAVRTRTVRRASGFALALLVAGLASPAGAHVRSEALPQTPTRGTHAVNAIRAGFLETVVADSLDSPVSMAIAPDGRVFVCEQRGTLRVVRDERLLPRPFVTVPTRAVIEEGLLGVALDPAFPRRPWVYVCFTALEPVRHNRIVRFTASGDTALASSAKVIFDFDPLVEHNLVGGALRFGPDGRLYASAGENGNGPLAQSLGSTAGKLVRLEPDGTIPRDNPFFSIAGDHRRAIWALGFRNPFSFDLDRASGRLLVNDVGANALEEVDDVVAGGNYGWPLFEGGGASARYRAPLHAYAHDQGGCAITGAAFYSPRLASFPREWIGRYFFGEYCRNEIRWLDPARPAQHGVFGVTLACGPVDLRVSSDGSLWYLARGNSGPVGGEGSSRGILVRVTHTPVDSSPFPARGPGSR